MKLEISSLRKSYGSQTALDGLSLSIPAGVRCLALIGPSGGGKSTLLRHLGGIEAPCSGTITVNGYSLPIQETSLLQYRRKNGFLFQAYNLFPHLTACQNIILPLVEVHAKSQSESRHIAITHLDRFGLSNHADKLPTQLSGGQQQRVALIRALVSSPQLLFLDEPTAALDPEMTVEVLELVRELLLGGQEIILCTHEMGFARAVADQIAFIARGKVIEVSPPEELFNSPKHPDVARFLTKVLEFR